MTALADGFGGYLILLAVGFLVHEPWRWIGLVLGRNLDVNSEVFRWVRAVSIALVAALVARLVVFPAGELEGIALWLRLVCTAVGFACFYATRKNLAAGIAGGSVLLVASKVWLS